MSFDIYLAWGPNAEQLFLKLFWVQRMSKELPGKDTGFQSVCGECLWLNASQTFGYVMTGCVFHISLDFSHTFERQSLIPCLCVSVCLWFATIIFYSFFWMIMKCFYLYYSFHTLTCLCSVFTVHFLQEMTILLNFILSFLKMFFFLVGLIFL